MLPNVIKEILEKPKTIQFISFFHLHQTAIAIMFVSLCLLFTGGLIFFSQEENRVQVLGIKAVKPTPTKKPPKPTSTPKPTRSASSGQAKTTPTSIATPKVIPSATPSPTPSENSSNGGKPSTVLDLSNWKLTIPTGNSESPTEIQQPALKDYVHDVWFSVNGGGVRFKAPVNAVTTSGSNYPRSELREMKNGGKDRAEWSSKEGTHIMTIDEAITALPQKKPHVVAGQIHDASDDVIVIRLEGSTLYVNVDGKNLHTLDSAYTLGKRFTVKFEVSGGVTKIYYNGSEVYTLSKDYSGAYFKAGAYTQSNCSKEDNCSEGNYGEVVIYSLNVTHS